MSMTSIAEKPLADVLRRARRAQEAWAQLPVRQRLRLVRSFRHLLVEESTALCEAVARDLNKPADEVIAGEILPLAAACRFLEREANGLLRPRRTSAWQRPIWLWGQADTIHRRPRGVVGIIGTWNYPILLNGVQIVQALTAGNAIVWKPSELGPSSAKVIVDLLLRAGCPQDLVQSLPATREAGQDLANADVDHIVFTGSSTTGRKLAETLGRRLVSSTLELSGCDALFVLDDANIDLAARAAWFGSTVNCGQTCIAARRAIVHRSVYQSFIDALKSVSAAALPMHLALESQATQATRLIHDAQAQGATVLDTSRPTEKNGEGTSTCWPTIVLDAKPEMSFCQEASFAPILSVMPFDTVEEAVQMDALCPYALGASVFTGSAERGLSIASHLRAGMVTVNDVVVPTAHPATPFGGRGESGWGVTQGPEGLLEMTVPQVVSVRGGSFRPHYGASVGKPPMSAERFRGLLQWSHAATFGKRMRGLFRMVRG
ncbi:MAG TPA: aldehyde dehydrogenase family protein [Gemmataceae bacterium]|nr:aldehyde dehydrogenase family protein [Gemmataceae bacterium]